MLKSPEFIVHVFRIENCCCLQNFVMLGYYFLNLNVPVAIWTSFFYDGKVQEPLTCVILFIFLPRKFYNKKQQLGVLNLRTHCK